MVKAPRKVRLQGIERRAQACQRAQHGFGLCLRTERRQTLAQPFDQCEQLPDIGRALPFGALAQARIGALLITHLQRADEQPWVLDHARPGRTRGTLVVLEPGMKFASAQRCRCQRTE
jgi:hypothetical protein